MKDKLDMFPNVCPAPELPCDSFSKILDSCMNSLERFTYIPVNILQACCSPHIFERRP
jgi:hypothetical protein